MASDEGMIERLPRARRNLVLVAIGALFFWFAWTIRQVVNPLLVGYLLAFILHPLVGRLHQLGLSKRAAVNGIFVSGFLLLGGTVLGLFVQVRALARDVAENPELRQRIEQRVEETRETIGEWLGPEWEPDLDADWIVEWARGFYSEHTEGVKAAGRASLVAAEDALRAVARFLGGVFAFVGALFLIPLYTYFLLFELDRIHGSVRRYLPARDRERLSRVAEGIGEVVSNFFRGRLGVCVLKGAFLTAGLWIAGIPYAFLFGMSAGFLSLVPFFGPALGFVAATLFGLLEHGLVGALVRTGVVFGAAELLEGYVLIPKILGDSLGLHPVVVLFALFAGGAALGMLGVLIALPVAASLLIVARELVLPALRRSADDAPEPGTG